MNVQFNYMLKCLKSLIRLAISVDPDQTPRFVASDLALHSLLRLVCLHTLGKYGMFNNIV